jgi:hypothetical protein
MSLAPAVLAAFHMQVRGCAQTGSPIYAELIERMADDLERGGVFAEIVAAYRGNPVLDALPLRVLGAVHALVLQGRAPELARFYPSAGGSFEPEGAWQALLAMAREHRDALHDAALHRGVQTNEVRRSAVLLPGLLRVAAATRLPLRVREIGASGGLNLVLDRYRYELGPHRFGDPASTLAIAAEWSGAAPDLAAPFRIASRRGCDVAPIDLRDPAARMRLLSFVWPEQLERIERLRAAQAIVAADPPPIDAEPAGTWVAREIRPVAGETTILCHSVMWWYVPEAERDAITRSVEAAGEAATPDAPLAWLRMEGARVEETELRLRLWPGGEDVQLAAAHWHGAWVRWLA